MPVSCELTECGAECVDLDEGVPSGNSVTHCGGCDRACSLANASASSCEAGECAPTCDVGFDDCLADDGSGTTDDGCETAITNTTNCGACGHTCSTANASATACTAGLCAPTCEANFLDCNVNGGSGADDGCETPTNTTASCGTTCQDVAACEAGADCTPTGCEAIGMAILTIPFTMAGETQRYGAAHATSAVDLTNDRVNVRVYAPGATAGLLNIYLIDAAGPAGPGIITNLTDLSSDWVTISIPVGPAAGEWDPSFVRQVTLDVSSGDNGPWATPTVVYVDRVWSDNGLLNDRFPDSSGPMVISTFTTVAGSTLGWTEQLPP